MVKYPRAVTLLALVLSAATLPMTALAANVCQNPTFRLSHGSPFTLEPMPGIGAQPTALAAGTYVVRPNRSSGCGCDLAVGLMSKNLPHQGFVARLRGNDDGTFTRTKDALHQVDGIPVAVVTGRFQTGAPVDDIVVVSSPASGQGNGHVQVFAPDASGVYPQRPSATFTVGLNPVAIVKGDFNGDNMLDVAIINRDDSSLTILLGDGQGGFADPIPVPNLGGSPESLTTGRFSGSPDADDIAVGVVQSVNGAFQVGIVIVPGSQNRQFAAKPIIPVGHLGSVKPSIAAANLSGPSLGDEGRRWRDLAIAFTDRTSSNGTIGRIKVLLGRNGGGFGDVEAAQTLDIGDDLPKSIAVVDLDDDDVVDLVVSAFSDSTSTLNGTIHFFQGHAAPAASVGFQANANWFTIPSTTQIRPRALVAGRFGNHDPALQLASMGIAAINAPDLDSIAVFQGNGQGSFVQPSLISTPLGDDDHTFISGDFHTPDGSSPVQDLAFLSKLDGRNVVRLLLANGAGGFTPPDPAQPPLLAGNSPSLMTAGQFATGPTSLALIDDAGGAGQQPVLKIFFGQGNGVLTPGTELLLSDIGRPRDMTAGHFRGPNMPLDIALVSDTTPPGSSSFSGKLTLLINDGQGVFSVGPQSQVLNFSPSLIVTSSRLRPGGRADLLIRDARANRFLFLVNIGNGFRPAIGPNNGFFDGAGGTDDLLVGNVTHNDPNALDDVITYEGATLTVFVNNGLESFDRHTPVALAASAGPPYLLADFGSGTLSLAAPVSSGGQISLLMLQGDGTGGFTPATAQVPPESIRGTATTTLQTKFLEFTPAASLTANMQVLQTVIAQFRSTLHGNGKPDFAFITKATENGRTVGNCPGDTTPLKPQERRPHDKVCPAKITDPAECGGFQHTPCFQGDCCRCNDLDIPKAARCTSCPFPDTIVTFAAACDRVSTFTPVLTVFANTCGD